MIATDCSLLKSDDHSTPLQHAYSTCSVLSTSAATLPDRIAPEDRDSRIGRGFDPTDPPLAEPSDPAAQRRTRIASTEGGLSACIAQTRRN